MCVTMIKNVFLIYFVTFYKNIFTLRYIISYARSCHRTIFNEFKYDLLIQNKYNYLIYS